MKKLKTQIVLATAGAVLVSGCKTGLVAAASEPVQKPEPSADKAGDAPRFKPRTVLLSDSTVYGRPLDEVPREQTLKSGLEQKLKALAVAPEPVELSLGAMCYDVAVMESVAYLCPVCNTSVTDRYDTWTVLEIEQIVQLVGQIKQAGFDVELDQRAFCPHCSQKEIPQPELIFRIRFSPEEEYHTVRSNIVNEYRCLHTFLVTDKSVYSGDRDREYALKNQIDILCKMTGLGRDLQIKSR